MPEVVIIGAGLTGLSAAYHLEQNNFHDFEIYEKGPRPGGLLCSEKSNDFTFDYTGHYLHVNDHGFYNFLDAVAGIDHFDAIQRRSAIYLHNTFVDYPIQMNLFGLPTDVIYACLNGYINRPTSRAKPQTFYDWVIKHFGHGFGKEFFFPYNSKLLAYPVKKIHHAWTGRFVPQTSLHDIIKGALEKNPHARAGYNASFYYPKQGGIESFITKLVQKISKPIKTNHEAVAIDPHKKIITFANGTKTSYATLITTAPLDATLQSLTSSSRSSLSAAAQNLWCNSVINFNLGFSQPDIGPHHWVYFPETSYPFYRIGFWHNISTSLVAQNCSGIYGELSYQPRKRSRAAMQKQADVAMIKTLDFLGLTINHIAASMTLDIRHAYVTYNAWREKNVPRLLTTLAALDIQSIGRFGAWKYSSMQEAYIDGKESVMKVLNELTQKRSKSIWMQNKQNHSIKGNEY